VPLRATTVSRWSRLFFATEPYRDLGAGAIAAALTTPLDVLVTHTMTDSNAPAERKGLPVGSDPVTKGPLELLRQGGSSTLTKGIGLRVLYYAPSIAIFFTIYEGMRRFLDCAI